MSYILDALRKSERERQTGQVPGLPTLATDPPQATPRWLYGLIGLLLVINLLGLGYWLFLRPKASTEPAMTAANPPGPASSPAVHADQAATTPIGNAGSPAPGPASAMNQPAPVAAVSVAPTPPAVSQPATASSPVTMQSIPPPPVPPPSAPPMPLPAQPAMASAPVAIQPVDAPPMASRELPRQPSALAAPERADAPARPTARRKPPRPAPYNRADAREDAEVEQETEEELLADSRRYEPDPEIIRPLGKQGIPYLKDLPLSFQDRIPPIRISMFAYSRNPAERFVIIDMKKLRVGDQIPGGALLMEIQAESLLLELEGQKFLMPRF